jgi:hypothetical protein
MMISRVASVVVVVAAAAAAAADSGDDDDSCSEGQAPATSAIDAATIGADRGGDCGAEGSGSDSEGSDPATSETDGALAATLRARLGRGGVLGGRHQHRPAIWQGSGMGVDWEVGAQWQC